MKKLFLTAAILIAAGLAAYFGGQQDTAPSATSQALEARNDTQSGDEAIKRAFESHASGIPVEGGGTVEKILADDRKGSKHQRFIVRLKSGQTILIAHNIDLAPRVASLKEGSSVMFSGVYEWNRNGGTVHWTHLDPDGSHRAGWIKYQGRIFQ